MIRSPRPLTSGYLVMTMSDNGQLTPRSDFLAPMQRRYRTVHLSSGQVVRIRNLTEREKSAFEAAVLTSKGEPSRSRIADLNRRLIVITLVDTNGDLLLTPADVVALEELDGAITTQLVDAIREHCGFAEGDIEGLVKNSERITGAASPSD